MRFHLSSLVLPHPTHTHTECTYTETHSLSHCLVITPTNISLITFVRALRVRSVTAASNGTNVSSVVTNITAASRVPFSPHLLVEIIDSNGLVSRGLAGIRVSAVSLAPTLGFVEQLADRGEAVFESFGIQEKPGSVHSLSFKAEVEDGVTIVSPTVSVSLRLCVAGEYYDGVLPYCQLCPGATYSDQPDQVRLCLCERVFVGVWCVAVNYVGAMISLWQTSLSEHTGVFVRKCLADCSRIAHALSISHTHYMYIYMSVSRSARVQGLPHGLHSEQHSHRLHLPDGLQCRQRAPLL